MNAVHCLESKIPKNRTSLVSTDATISIKIESNMLVRKKWFHWCDANLSTKKGQNCQMIKIIALVVIPIFVMVIENAIKISDDAQKLTKQNSVKEDISFSVEIGLLVHYLQIERGTTAFYISSGGSSVVLDGLQKKRLDTDLALDNLSGWVSVSSPTHFQSHEQYRARLQDYRDNLDPLNTTIQAAIKFYSDDNNVIIGWVGTTVKESDSETTWQLLTSYHMLLISKEQAGIERALGSTFYARGIYLA